MTEVRGPRSGGTPSSASGTLGLGLVIRLIGNIYPDSPRLLTQLVRVHPLVKPGGYPWLMYYVHIRDESETSRRPVHLIDVV